MKRKNFYIDKLGGVNPEETLGNCTSYVQNMISKDGILKSRSGWKVIADFKDEEMSPLRINGIYEYKTDTKSAVIVHAGTHIYECDYEMKNKTEVPVAYGIEVPDRRTQGYMYGGLLWICGVGDLAVYNGETVYGVYEYNQAYVPTTSVSVLDDYIAKKPAPYQSPNVLTRKRKNSLRGAKSTKPFHKFYLDSKAEYGKPFTFTAKFRVRSTFDSEDEVTTDYIGMYADGKSINTVVVANIHTDSLTEEMLYLTDGLKSIYGQEIFIDGQDVSAWGIQITNGNELYINFVCPTYITDTDNIVVEFTEDSEFNRDLRLADHCAVAIMERGKSIMLLCRGDNEILYSNEDYGFFYFPESNKFSIGQETTRIVGILPMANNFIGIFKEDGFFRVKIDGSKMGEYRIYTTSDTYGASNPFLVSRLNHDYLTVNENGVFGIRELDETEEGISKLYCRSSNISKEFASFTKEELLDAMSLVVGNTYYLFVANKVYVTNSDSTFYKSGKSDDEFEYTWWIFDNCPCSYALSLGSTLYMGRENGEICIFDGGFTDRKTVTLKSPTNDFLFNEEDGVSTVVFNQNLKTYSPCKICLDKHFIYISKCTYIKNENRLEIPLEAFFSNEEIQFYDGMKIMLLNENGEESFAGEITSTYPSLYSVFCEDFTFDTDGEFYLYVENDKNTEYVLKEVVSGYKLIYKGKEIKLYSNDIKTVYLIFEETIVCRIETAVTDFNEDGRKNLYSIEFTPTEDSKGIVRVGYETIKNSFSKEIKLGSYLDFDSLDLEAFGFNPRFKKKVRVNCFERNFDYIRIKIEAEPTKGFGIEKICLNYSV